MKKLTALMLLLGSAASAQNVPSTVMYTGKLADGGIPVDGVRNFDLRLYDDPTAGTLVWDEQYFSIPVVAGLFSVVMGSAGNPVDPADLTSGNRWLQVAVDGVPLLPRIKVHSVPYAIVAGEADSLEGFVAADFVPITASCPVDSAIQSFDAFGNAVCESDDNAGGDITGVTAGTGLLDGGTSGDVTLNVNFASFGACMGTDKVTGWNAVSGMLQCGTDVDSGGSVTSVATGSGLTGGPFMDTGTISVATGGITATHLADATVFATVQDDTPADQFTVTDGANGIRFEGATGLVATFGAMNHRVIYGIAPNGVTTGLIADDTIAAADIASNAIGNLEMGDNAIGSAEIAVDSIADVDIATGSVGTLELKDGQVAFADWSLNGCTANQIAKVGMAGTAWVCSGDATGTVTSVSTGLGLTGGAITTTGTVDLLLNASGGLSKMLGVPGNELGIAASGVTSAMIADSNITTSDIALDTIAAVDIAPSAVGTSEILDGTVAVADLAAGALASAGTVALSGSVATTTVAQIDSFTVNAPGPGTLVVTVEGQFWIDADATGTASDFARGNIGLCDTTASSATCGGTYNTADAEDPDNGASTNVQYQFNRTRVVTVAAAGARVFYLNGTAPAATDALSLGSGATRANAIFLPAASLMSVTNP